MPHQPIRPLDPGSVILLAICVFVGQLVLAGGLIVLAWWLGALAAGPEPYSVVQGVLGSLIGRLALAGFIAALFYHLANGVRHLLWDTGRGFELNQAKASSRLVIAVAAVLTVVAWIAALV